MKPKFTRKFATNLFYSALIILVGIIITYIIRYGMLDSSMWHLNNLSRLATILLGSVGVIITFTGVMLYFSVLYKNNFTSKLTLSLNNFIFFLEHHNVDNPNGKTYLENDGLELISDTYKYLRKGFSPDKDFDVSDMDLLSILNSNMVKTYEDVFVRYFNFVNHITDLIFESEISADEKTEYYNTLKLNLSSNTIAPLLYIYYNKLETIENGDAKKKLSKKIKESGLFDDYSLKNYLLNPIDKVLFDKKVNQFI
ncbi:hypothetical protein SAMN05444148_2641 [Winogradskyella jejuensis]|uniref:Phage abortive infection protein n=2 Tax=Winogradskyella jejuensis TaxID=1089305 RepID=A0A1M5UYI9_9FLAO|nr:hypothetical protein SAMN05444148_2641 [Winogradskyella jejuensis]